MTNIITVENMEGQILYRRLRRMYNCYVTYSRDYLYKILRNNSVLYIRSYGYSISNNLFEEDIEELCYLYEVHFKNGAVAPIIIRGVM